MNRRIRKRRKKRGLVLVAVIVLIILLCFLALYYGLTVARYEITSPKIDAPVRLVHLSDLHSTFFGAEQSALLAAIDREDPDFVLMTGDIADDKVPHAGTIALLRGLEGRYPCFYVTGNHEFWGRETAVIKQMFRNYGVAVLEGERVSVTAGGQTLNICGVDDRVIGREAFSKQLDRAFAGIDDRHFTVLLAHRPERIREYAPYGADLVLSGHAHGGQWRIPIINKGMYAPNQGLFPEFAGGRYDLPGACMVVSRGLTKLTLPPRLFNPPELVVIDIVPAS